MKKNRLYYYLLTLACLFFVLFVFLSIAGKQEYKGPTLILGFITLAIAVRGFPTFKGFSYSLWIFTAVTVSMYYPKYFLSAGNFEFKLLIVPLLQIIMFGMGSQMSLSDFAGVIKMPKGVIAGVICQFTIMPLIGITIATIFNFPPEIAAGIVLVGSSPSGLASNVMSFIAKANLALSVTLTAFATLLSPLLTPFLMKTLAGQFIEVDFWSMMLDIFNMVILPIIAGLIFNIFSISMVSFKGRIVQLISYLLIVVLKNFIAFQTSDISFIFFLKGIGTDIFWFMLLPYLGTIVFKYFAKGNKEWLNKALAFISMLGIGIIITIITAAGRDSLLEVGLLLILACFIHNMFGYGLGYTIARFVLRMNEQDCRTIALEVGMQNGGLASGLALQMGKVTTVGLAPAVFGPMMNITGSSLATWWRNKIPGVKK
ncbi:bile acid:sodium symporter family protein [Maribellus maritimus]|uniref:bile acid:sodium symporter family protein n=1 Tax=Maribellus maritimus TaxID=2870838 RepID=UPI001EEBCAE6|nr:bile acid:sodium symporter family protein [Maribellus maritimus]MCG6186814.1 bile acid:sodium symporter family protein [Maribellus maritimus]